MKRNRFALALFLLVCFVLTCAAAFIAFAPRDQREAAKALVSRHVPQLRSVLEQKSSGTLVAELFHGGFKLGQPMLLRIYKQESELEVWLMRDNRFERFKTYPICKWSGQIGPKLKEGDGQSPEGFYEVSLKQLNPNSKYHLAFNLGFPNAFDVSQSRNGSALMVHGSCVSIGCYAMTDAGIEDIYRMVEEALLAKQHSIPVHIFPFRMTVENLTAHSGNPWAQFWNNLAEGDALFHQTKRPPEVFACNGRYYFDNAPAHCEKVQSW